MIIGLNNGIHNSIMNRPGGGGGGTMPNLSGIADIYFADNISQNRVYRIDPITRVVTELWSSGHTNNFRGIGADDTHVYVMGSSSTNTFYKINRLTGVHDDNHINVGSRYGVAVEDDYVYTSQSSNRTFDRFSKPGFVKSDVGVQTPVPYYYIAIGGGYIFGGSNDDGLSRSDIDGTNHVQLVEQTGVFACETIPSLEKVLFASVDTEILYMCDYDGGNVEEVITGYVFDDVVASRVDSATLLLTHASSNKVYLGHLSGYIEDFADGNTGPRGITIGY